MMQRIEVIDSGALAVFESAEIEDFRKMALFAHPFGPEAVPLGQSPIAMRVNFRDGNTCKFRGDTKTPYVNIMIENLRGLLSRYRKQDKLESAVMYDNRPGAFFKIIIRYEAGRVIENKLPLYSPSWVVKNPAPLKPQAKEISPIQQAEKFLSK